MTSMVNMMKVVFSDEIWFLMTTAIRFFDDSTLGPIHDESGFPMKRVFLMKVVLYVMSIGFAP